MPSASEAPPEHQAPRRTGKPYRGQASRQIRGRTEAKAGPRLRTSCPLGRVATGLVPELIAAWPTLADCLVQRRDRAPQMPELWAPNNDAFTVWTDWFISLVWPDKRSYSATYEWAGRLMCELLLRFRLLQATETAVPGNFLGLTPRVSLCYCVDGECRTGCHRYSCINGAPQLTLSHGRKVLVALDARISHHPLLSLVKLATSLRG